MQVTVAELVSMAVSVLSFIIACATAWTTLWRRGTVRLAQPPSIYLGPDGVREHHPKVFLRALLYSTAARGHVMEGMYARLRRGNSIQSFPVWVCGEAKGELERGAGLAVTSAGVARHHHFLLPNDGTTYSFLPGSYDLEVYGVLVGRARPLKLHTVALTITEMQSARLQSDQKCGLYFDWSPETGRYHEHISNARPPSPPSLFVLAEATDQDE